MPAATAAAAAAATAGRATPAPAAGVHSQPAAGLDSHSDEAQRRAHVPLVARSSCASPSASASSSSAISAIKRWTTRVQMQLYRKCAGDQAAEERQTPPPAPAAAPGTEDASMGAQSAPATAGASVGPSAGPTVASSSIPHCALQAISTSQTFLHLIEAIQRSHPARHAPRTGVGGGGGGAAAVPRSSGIMMEPRFFPLQATVPTLQEIQQRPAASCTSELNRIWGATNLNPPAPSTSGLAGLSSAPKPTALRRADDQILVARLVSSRSTSPRTHPAMVFLKDRTACIPAVVIHADVQLLGRWCVFTKWNFLVGTDGEWANGIFEVDARDAVPLPPLSQPSLSGPPIVWPGFAQPPLPVGWQKLHVSPMGEIMQQLQGLTDDEPVRPSAPVPPLGQLESGGDAPPADGFSAGATKRKAITHDEAASRAKRIKLKAQLYSLRGVLTAISPLLPHERSPYFFVELRDCAFAATILFTGGGSTRWLPFLRLGETYTLTRLRTSALFPDRSAHHPMVFVSTVDTQAAADSAAGGAAADESPFDQPAKQTLVLSSRMTPRGRTTGEETPNRSQQAENQPTMECDLGADSTDDGAAAAASSSFLPPSSWLTYTGRITANPTWGVYVLDDDSRCLLLVHASAFSGSATASSAGGVALHPWLACGVGLRVGARVRLTNVHLVVQGGQQIGFACCLYSHIAILHLAGTVAAGAPLAFGVQTPTARWYSALWCRSSPRSLVLRMKLWLDWKEKIGQLVGSQELLERLLVKLMASQAIELRPEHPSPPAPLMETNWQTIAQFFHHDTCILVEPPAGVAVAASSSSSSSLSVSPRLPVLLPLARLVDLPPVSRLRESLHDSSSSSSFHLSSSSWSQWRYRTLSSHQLPSHLALVGVLQSTIAPPDPWARSKSSAALVRDRPAPSSPVLRTAWQLVDRSAAIDCVLCGGAVQPAHRNAIVLVRRYVICLETSPKARTKCDGSATEEAWKMVILIDVNDLEMLQTPKTDVLRMGEPADDPAGKVLLLVQHQSETIRLPSVTTAGPPAGGGGVAAPSAVSASQSLLSSGAFNPILTVAIEAAQYDERMGVVGPTIAVHLAPCIGDLYSFLQPRSLLEVSNLTETSTESGRAFRLDSKSGVRIHARPPTVGLPPLQQVRSLLTCALPPSSSLPAGGLPLDRVDFEGLVMEKQFRLEQPTPIGGVAGGPPTRAASRSYRRWWLLVRDLSEPHTIAVYWDPAAHCFPLVLPGCHVRLFRAQRKLAANWTIEVESGEGSRIELVQSAQIERGEEDEDAPPAVAASTTGSPAASSLLHEHRRLRSLLSRRFPCPPLPLTLLGRLSPFAPVVSTRLHRVRGRCGVLTKLVCQWTCAECAGEVVKGRGRCPGGIDTNQTTNSRWEAATPTTAVGVGARAAPRRSCSVSSLQCALSLVLLLDDGSGVATTLVDGPPAWSFLSLSTRERSQLEDLALALGGSGFEYFRPIGSSRSADRSESLVSSSDGVALRCAAHVATWEKRLKEEYAGVEIVVHARQLYAKGVLAAAIERESKKRRANENQKEGTENKQLTQTKTQAQTQPPHPPPIVCAAGAAGAGGVGSLGCGSWSGSGSRSVSLPVGSSSSSSFVPFGSSSSCSLPFSSCSFRPLVGVGSSRWSTLCPPALTLRAIELHRVKDESTRTQARATLQQIRRRSQATDEDEREESNGR